MSPGSNISSHPWSIGRKVSFRFFFIFLLLIIAPWNWLEAVLGISSLLGYGDQFQVWLVEAANAHLFHVRPVLVPANGSGDTSFCWAQLWTELLISVTGSVIWTVADRRRSTYNALNYWLCLLARYHIALVAFSYGIIKLFRMQMPFPSISQLATPLGDFLPMRLSWLFIGYSGPYQVFSGCMEVLAGVLLLYRRTATLGTMLATGVFLNVAMLNLSYDIPVKIFSIEILVLCLFLLAHEWQRISCFFILNRPADTCAVYYCPLKRRWMRISRIVLKLAFIVLAIGVPIVQTWNYSRERQTHKYEPVKTGLYDVAMYTINKDTLTIDRMNAAGWKNMVFEGNGFGSVATNDTAFRQQYGRGYFSYSFDTALKFISINKPGDDGQNLLTLDYYLPDSNTIRLSGMLCTDSLSVLLKRNTHHYQLSERQFHWLSERNR